jgi:hypothetical protein
VKKVSLSPEMIAAAKLARAQLAAPVPNFAIAIGWLDAFLALAGAKEEALDAPAASRVVTFTEAARTLGYSPKHVRHLAKTKRIPIIGSGRSARVLIDEAIEALRTKGHGGASTKPADEIESAGAAFARRGRLRAV